MTIREFAGSGYFTAEQGQAIGVVIDPGIVLPLDGGTRWLPSPFTSAIPLNALSRGMRPTCVTGPITFSAAPGAIPGANCVVGLTADGVTGHAPNFGPFTLAAGATGWNNAAGTGNTLYFSVDATGALFYSNTPSTIPVPCVLSTSASGSAITIGLGGSSIVTVTIPPLSAFTLVATRNGNPAPYALQNVALGANSVTLNLTGATAHGDAISLTYTPPSALASMSQIQDSGGNWLNAFSVSMTA